MVAIQVTVIANQHYWGAETYKLMEISTITTILLLVAVNGFIIGRSSLTQLFRTCKHRRFKKKRENVLQERKNALTNLENYIESKSNNLLVNK